MSRLHLVLGFSSHNPAPDSVPEVVYIGRDGGAAHYAVSKQDERYAYKLWVKNPRGTTKRNPRFGWRADHTHAAPTQAASEPPVMTEKADDSEAVVSSPASESTVSEDSNNDFFQRHSEESENPETEGAPSVSDLPEDSDSEDDGPPSLTPKKRKG